MDTDCNILSDYSDVLCTQELIKILNIGKNTVYKLLKSDAIHSVKIGKQYKIPKPFLLKYLLNNNSISI